jgi:hypothetical protein
VHHAALAFIVIAVTLTPPCRAEEPAQKLPREISWNKTEARFEASNLPASTLEDLRHPPANPKDWRPGFSVHVIDKHGSTREPMLGEFALIGDVATFKPRFPLRPGLKYHAFFSIGFGRLIDKIIELPAEAPHPTATVEAVYPTSDKLPENLLKFYIHFTAPMSRGEAYERLHILNVTDPAAPREVPDAFLRLGEELWDSSGQRFTLLFDPGRIKRGLTPNMEEGAPLLAGRRYALVVDRDWRDAHGQPLAQSFRKEFTVTPFDDEQPDPRAWELHIPQRGDTEPFMATFPEPLDHALLEHSLVIKNAAGEEIDGVGVPLEHDTSWLFQPTKPWQPGDYKLVVAPILEDLAGNSVGRAFETQAREVVDQGTLASPVELPLKIKH